MRLRYKILIIKREQINYIGSMRKQKLSSSKQIPIQLSANKKSHSINLKTKQQPLFAPYKIDWKSPSNDNVFYGMAPSIPLKQPLRNIENNNSHTSNTNSKAFYQNMKNQLMSIKQDVEKLIMKEKKPSFTTADQSVRNDSFDSNQMNNGCINTLNIKNKCQLKMNKISSLYQNVDKVLANKICDSAPPTKFTVGESRLDHPLMHNFINDQVRNNYNMESNYRSQKQTYVRTKSKSIADTFNKATDLHTINLANNSKENNLNAEIESWSQKQITSKLAYRAQINQEEQESYPVKPKIQVEINLPSFDRMKTKEKIDDEKNKIIQKLKKELQQLQNELQLRNDLMSKKESSKFQLTEEVQKLTKLLETQKHTQSQLQKRNQQLQQKLISNKQNNHSNEINQIRQKYENEFEQLSRNQFQQQNKLNYLQSQLQKSINVIRQKEQQNYHLIQQLNSQNKTIQQLSDACEQLGTQINSMKESVEESRKSKEKLKLKENQLYIYQEELKEAKSKIKQLKQDIQCNNQLYNKLQGNSSINDHKNITDLKQTQTLNSQLKETQKINHILKSENDRIKNQLQSLKQLNSDNQTKIKQVLKENSQLNKKICQMEKHSQKNLQQLMNNEGFQSIGEQISRKLSTMVDQNYILKNKISHLQSTLEQITLKNRSLTYELMIYEEKVILQKDCTRRLKIQDWDNLTDERDNLKIQLENVQSRLEETKQFYQVQTMKKQNQIHELKGQINDMIEIQPQNHQNIHPHLRSVKHIKNLDVLFNEFKDMIQYNLEMKQQINKLKSLST